MTNRLLYDWRMTDESPAPEKPVFLAHLLRAESQLPKRPLCKQWPYAGCPTSILAELKQPLKEDAEQCTIEGHTYRVTNGYLIPYYEPRSDILGSNKLEGRNEERIHALANHFFNFCQPELKIPRTAEQIRQSIEAFQALPESTPTECSAKAGYFRVLVGASMMRLELLGEIINEKRVPNDKQAYVHFDNAVAPDSAEMKAQLDALKAECKTIYSFLQRQDLIPIWRTILYHDNHVDHDGLLIDIMREIGKPIRVENEAIEKVVVRDGVVRKIGWSLESIDQIHDVIHTLMRKPAFALSVRTFLEKDGPRYGVHTVEDIRERFEEFTQLSRARACIPSRDGAYDEVFARRAVLAEMFNAPTGVLQSMRRVGNKASTDNRDTADIRDMRALMTHGIKVMIRTANSRTPSNQEAPEVFIPNLDENASPMETYLAQTFLKPSELKHARQVYKQAEEMKLSDDDRKKFFSKAFSSVGLLDADLKRFERKYSKASEIAP